MARVERRSSIPLHIMFTNELASGEHFLIFQKIQNTLRLKSLKLHTKMAVLQTICEKLILYRYGVQGSLLSFATLRHTSVTSLQILG